MVSTLALRPWPAHRENAVFGTVNRAQSRPLGRETERVSSAIAARRFIGRSSELGRLESLLERAADGVSHCAIVSGAAGVGKSSLLREFASRTDSRVLVGSCLPLGDQGVPYAPVIEILRSLEFDPNGNVPLPDGLGSLDPTSTDPGAGPTSRSHLFQAVLTLFTRLVDSGPGVVVIEDLHWADRSTRDLLSFLIPNLRAERLLLVLSYRTDDVHRNHPLRPLLAEFQRNPSVVQLDVVPFTSSLVAEQMTNLTGHPPTAADLDEVMRRTQGNPYFVEELVAAEATGNQALPDSLRELLLVRTDVVSADARRTLRILSIAEHQVTEQALARIAATPIPDIREHIHQAIDTRLLVRSATGTTFAHALLREALQTDLLPGERTEFHAAFAEVLADEAAATTPNRAGILAMLAHHRAAAGDIAGAIEAWSGAATAAEAIFAFDEAHHHLARIIENWDRISAPDDLVGSSYADLVARAAENAFLAGDPTDASQLTREAIALVDADVDPGIAGMLYERLARYVRDTDGHDRALAYVERALELVPDDPPSVDLSRVLAGVAGQLMTHGRYAEARELASRAADVARTVSSIVAEADALNTLGVVTTVIDDVEAGVAMLHSALALAKRCGDPHQQMRSYWNTMACLSDAGEWERALAAFEVAIEQLPRLGQAHLLPELFSNAADILMRLGRWDEAQATVDEAHLRFGSGASGSVLTELVVERGDFDAARRLIESRTAHNVFTDQEQQGWPLVNLAALETWEGHRDAARQAVDDALDVTADLDAPIATACALAIGCRCEADAAEFARNGASADEVDLALTRSASLLGQITDLLARPGPINGWKREVGALKVQCDAERSRALGVSDAAAWSATTAAWQAMSMPYHAAYARWREAEALFTTTADRPGAAVLLRESHEIAESLGARPLEGLIESFARRARIDLGLPNGGLDRHGLTGRELEVLEALCVGATNRQIAASLYISEKTASVHVSNIMRKLGASNRGQAAAIARREGLSI